MICIAMLNNCTHFSQWDNDPRPSFICDVAEQQGIKPEDITNTLLVINEVNVIAKAYSQEDVCNFSKNAINLVNALPTWGTFIGYISTNVDNVRIVKISQIILRDAPMLDIIREKDREIILGLLQDLEGIYCSEVSG